MSSEGPRLSKPLKGFGRFALVAARLLYATVFVWNVMCAVQFVCTPGVFAPGFQLGGVAGDVAVRGIGVAFLMWNATYVPFIWNPERFSVLGWIVLAQQMIGLFGETFILCTIPDAEFEVLRQSITRFIAFDFAGLLMMLAALGLLRFLKR